MAVHHGTVIGLLSAAAVAFVGAGMVVRSALPAAAPTAQPAPAAIDDARVVALEGEVAKLRGDVGELTRKVATLMMVERARSNVPVVQAPVLEVRPTIPQPEMPPSPALAPAEVLVLIEEARARGGVRVLPSDQVRAIQDGLRPLGLWTGDSDGVPGARFIKAVERARLSLSSAAPPQ